MRRTRAQGVLPERSSLLGSSSFRLALVYISLFSTAVLILVGLIYWAATDSVTRQIDATIDAEIRGLAEHYQRRGLSGLVEVIRRRSSSADAARGLYLLAGARFEPLAGNLTRWPDEPPDEAGWVTFRLDFPEADRSGINFGRARVFTLGGQLHLLVGHDVRERDRIAAQIREMLIFGIIVTIALSLVGGVLMSRSILRRIDTINQASRRIMVGDLGQRVAISGRDDEFDELARNLNAMLDQIERLLSGMKQVTESIAHDLRSPLARLRSRLEITLMDQPPDADDASKAYRAAIEQTIAEADRLLDTFNALLNIAQAESGAPRRRFDSVDLAALVTDAAELYEPLAEEQGLSLAVEAAEPAKVRGDRDLLFQALSNLLDNAIKFSPPQGRLGIVLAPSGRSVDLIVWDRGEGIPEAARERVTERFYRLEASRSTPGSGLGLSLVAAVASLHGGALRLEDNEPGLRARLVLPATPLGVAEEKNRADPP